MVKSIHGSYKITYHPDGPEGEAVEIDFTPPFKRVNMIPTLESVLKVKFPAADQLASAEANKFLSDLCAAKGKIIILLLVIKSSFNYHLSLKNVNSSNFDYYQTRLIRSRY